MKTIEITYMQEGKNNLIIDAVTNYTANLCGGLSIQSLDGTHTWISHKVIEMYEVTPYKPTAASTGGLRWKA